MTSATPELEPASSAGARRDRGTAIWWMSATACVVLLSRRQLSDYDLPWNLATGRILLETGQVPKVDDLAFTARPLRYVEVIGDALLYAIHEVAGAAGLQVACAGLGVGALSLLVARAERLGALRWLWGSLGLFASSEWFIMRPVMFSYVGVISTLIILETHRRSPDRRRGRRALCWLVPLFFVWANIHGFVAAGAAFAVGYSLYRGAVRCFARIRPSPLWPVADGEDVIATSFIVGAALAAASVNTMGPRLLLGTLRSGEQFLVSEWAAPTLHYFSSDQPWLSLWFLCSLALWSSGRDPLTQSRLPSSFSIAQVSIACVLVGTAVRLLPFGAFVMAHAATTRMSRPLGLPPIGSVACAASPLSVVAALFLQLQQQLWRAPGFDRVRLPVDAAEFVATARPSGRMYNSMPYGGYLAWRLWPDYRVFTDGRDALAREPELVKAIAHANWRGEGFEALDRQFAFDWALISAREGEALNPGIARSREWAMVYLDDIAAVYVRARGPNAALAARGYKVLRHLVDPSVIMAEATAEPAPLAHALSHDGSLALAQAPDSPRAAFLAAAGAMAARDGQAFDAAYLRLAWLVPGHASLSVLAESWRQLERRATLPRASSPH